MNITIIDISYIIQFTYWCVFTFNVVLGLASTHSPRVLLSRETGGCFVPMSVNQIKLYMLWAILLYFILHVDFIAFSKITKRDVVFITCSWCAAVEMCTIKPVTRRIYLPLFCIRFYFQDSKTTNVYLYRGKKREMICISIKRRLLMTIC